ncbi:unnamed protein product [Cladocopium goreaui]|uniref:Uncharacterized protein n=1 Tax=Cladocopium goreaui TaxID=2562237 RepID=A0A9P1M4S4_9DINO|nr:unnamed protein product [Cladocopium goreaui]
MAPTTSWSPTSRTPTRAPMAPSTSFPSRHQPAPRMASRTSPSWWATPLRTTSRCSSPPPKRLEVPGSSCYPLETSVPPQPPQLWPELVPWVAPSVSCR